MSWIDVADLADVRGAEMIEVEAAGTAILLCDVSGTVYATSAICPHHSAWLSDGHIDGDCIHCPRHMGSFDIPTGAQRSGPPSPALPVYKVKVEEGRVFVDMPSNLLICGLVKL
jgi:nitrite reductase/ring-hydroxylating ferredoxin subunit